MRYRFSGSSEAPHRKASDEVLILRLARGPEPRGLGRAPGYRLARGRLGINSVTAASTDFPDEMSHPTNTFNHSRDVSRTMARYSGVADETGITSTPCYSRQDGAGVTGRCARHCAHDGHPCHTVLPNPCSGMESHVRVPVASETTCKANCSLRASATCFRAPVASGLAPAEPPTTVQPLHRTGPRLSTLSALWDRHAARSTRHALRRAAGAPTSCTGPSSCSLGVSIPAPSHQPGLGIPHRSNIQ